MRLKFADEHQEQASFIQWAQITYVEAQPLDRFLIMLPNEQLISHIAGELNRIKYIQRMKQLGFRKGASDLFLAFPCNLFHGLFIEMKRQRPAFRSAGAARNAVSHEQQEFGGLMRAAGYGFISPYGWEEAARLTTRYLDGSYAGEQMLEVHG